MKKSTGTKKLNLKKLSVSKLSRKEYLSIAGKGGTATFDNCGITKHQESPLCESS